MTSKYVCKMCGADMTIVKQGKYLKIVCTRCGSEIAKEVE